MADSVTMTSKLAATIGGTTLAGVATSTKSLYSTGGSTGVDLVQQTLTALCTAITFHPIATEIDMGDVWKTDGHAIHLKNTHTTGTYTHCIRIFVRTGHMITTGQLVVGQQYLVAGGVLTNNSVDWQIGEILTAAGDANFTGAGATAELLVPVAKLWPGDFFGPVRRSAFTAAGYGSLMHCVWGSASELSCPLEITAVEVGEPTS